MVYSKDIQQFADNLQEKRQVMMALGDANRQHLILEMIRMERYDGVRVGELTARTNLSRPAVSHHLKILKNAGLIRVRKDGTKNYYYFDAEEVLQQLIDSLTQAKSIMSDIAEQYMFDKPLDK